MNTVSSKITTLRAEMAARGLHGFIVPRADEFQGEFAPPCAERLKFLTGFTGSAGVAVVLADKAVVMSDGRYRVQLRQQVNLEIFDVADSTVQSVGGWLAENAKGAALIGYDPWLHTPDQIAKMEKDVAGKGMAFKPVENLIDRIWLDRPPAPCGAVELFPESVAGQSVAIKKAAIAEILGQEGADSCVICAPESVSWLLNVRGADVDYFPAVLSRAIVHADPARPVQWIVDPRKVPADMKNVAEILPPEEFSKILENVSRETNGEQKTLALDFTNAPQAIKSHLESAGAKIINLKDPCVALRAVKTPAEQAAIRKAHVQDGVALARFLCTLDSEAATLTELSVEEKLLKCRQKSAAFRGESFATIAGFGENGAIVHYRATPDTNKALTPESLLLLDSGGQYGAGDVWGTTDITRTIAIGTPSADMRTHFTLVLKGHIAVARAQFPEGTIGAQIDAPARAPLWQRGLDYAHGTGHGVGCYLSVHEEAASISPRGRTAFQAGMLISNEPGYYKEGAYGIRIESLVLVEARGICAETGAKMLGFDTVTLAPLDKRLIDTKMLERGEVEWLNAYHARVHEQIAPLLTGEDDAPVRAWLEAATRALS